MQVAQMPQVGQSNPAALQAVAGPDMLGAATAQGQYNMNTYNQQMAANNAMWGGLTQAGGMLGGAGIGAAFGGR
jgi:phage baseplate assembly protein gpV